LIRKQKVVHVKQHIIETVDGDLFEFDQDIILLNDKHVALANRTKGGGVGFLRKLPESAIAEVIAALDKRDGGDRHPERTVSVAGKPMQTARGIYRD
jgi:hypothetical protein